MYISYLFSYRDNEMEIDTFALNSFLHLNPNALHVYFFSTNKVFYFYVLLHLNPVNLLLKYMIIKFDPFTEIAIGVL